MTSLRYQKINSSGLCRTQTYFLVTLHSVNFLTTIFIMSNKKTNKLRKQKSPLEFIPHKLRDGDRALPYLKLANIVCIFCFGTFVTEAHTSLSLYQMVNVQFCLSTWSHIKYL